MAISEQGKLTRENLLNMDAITTAAKIANKEVTSEAVVQTYINHLRKINQNINALVEERFVSALEEAKEADLVIRNKKSIGPLHGVPISVKESFNVANMKTTGGLTYLSNNISTKDAFIVRKLTEAGAIIIGKTNTPSLCFCQETDNKLYGRTNNPWDITRTAGGSSGGEGALLAVGGATAGVGSDIGGSIRLPSHFNGVVGFKSGKFQLSPKGHLPNNPIPLQARMASFGPMGKSVADAKLLYELMSEKTLPNPNLDDIKIDVLQADLPFPISKSTKNLLNEVEQFLNHSYATKRSIPPFFTDTSQLWQEIMSIDGGENIKNIVFPNKENNVLTTYLTEKLTNKTEIHTYLSWALIGARLFKPSRGRVKEINKIIKYGDKQLDNFLENRLLIFPVYHTSALKHGEVYKEIFSIKKTFRKFMPFLAYANVWGLPSLTIPIGVDSNKMPIGIQIMSKNGNEAEIFELGKQLTKQFRRYKRCTIWDEWKV